MRPLFSLFLGLSICLGMSSFALNRTEEFGKAGYYADALHGRKTASGEKYDKDEFTCAHKTYAFGTRLRVTRLDNKKSVIVRVNDRGPYSEGFVVDLSRAAAVEIDLIKAGRANVKVEPVETEKSTAIEVQQASVPTATASTERTRPVTASTPTNTTAAKPRTQLLKAQQKGTPAARPVTYSIEDSSPAAAQKAQAATADKAARPSELYKMDLRSQVKMGFGVQVSTLYDADNVMPMVTKLQAKYPGKVLVSMERDEANNQSTYRIIVGPYPTRKAADNQQKKVDRNGNKGCFVIDLTTI